VRCPSEPADSVSKTGCPHAFRWICHPSCPLPLPEVLRRTLSCDIVQRVPEGWSLLPELDRPSTE